MTENPDKSCSRCGTAISTDAAGGLCPRCLMAMNFDSRTMPEGEGPPHAPILTPDELAEKFPQYEILECLGRGGMGVVYKARQKSLDRMVAIKILPPERVGEEKFSDRFAVEAATLAKLSHPNIVTVHDFGETGGLFYIVMEYVDGVNLRDLLRDGKLEPKQALAIVPPICDALQYAHDKGIVHRDIKPENLLLDRNGRIKIADFGIASLVGANGEIAGTPPYMAPEQKGTQIDHRADIYALGVVLYEMLTGERPAKDLVAPSKKVQIDVRLDEMVLRALEKEPERRYQTAGEFRTVVETMGTAPVTHGSPAVLLKSGESLYATPEFLATVWGAMKLHQGMGTLLLYSDRLEFQAGLNRTVIPLGSVRHLDLITYPFFQSPAGLHSIEVEHEDAGTSRRLVLTPSKGMFSFVGTTNNRVSEWLGAIREAITIETGSPPTGSSSSIPYQGFSADGKLVGAFVMLASFAALFGILGALAMTGSWRNYLPMAVPFIFGASFVLALAWRQRRQWRREHPLPVTPPPSDSGIPGSAAFTGFAVALLLVLTATNNAMAMMIGAGVVLIAALIWFAKGNFRLALLVALASLGVAGVVAFALSGRTSEARAITVDPSEMAITRILADGDKVLIEGKALANARIGIHAGERGNGWSCAFPQDCRFTATLEKTSRGLKCRVQPDAGNPILTMDRTNQIGDVKLADGKLSFRAGQPVRGHDGVWVADIGEWTSKGGAKVPIRVSLWLLKPPASEENRNAAPKSAAAGNGESAAMKFGPVIERVLSGNDSLSNCYLDAETGHVLSAPLKFVEDLKSKGQLHQGNTQLMNLMDWARDNGVDFVLQHQNPETSLQLLEGFTIASATPFDSCDASRVVRYAVEIQSTMAPQVHPGFHMSCALVAPGVDSWIFRTREGNAGVLQLTAVKDNPRDVKIRYKLVQSTTPKPPESSAPEQTASGPSERLSWMLEERPPLAEARPGLDAAPTFPLPADAVGWAESDGQLNPVMYLAKPVPRGGSEAPVDGALRNPGEPIRLNIYRGTNPLATANRFLGSYEITCQPPDAAIRAEFSLSPDGQLHLNVFPEKKGVIVGGSRLRPPDPPDKPSGIIRKMVVSPDRSNENPASVSAVSTALQLIEAEKVIKDANEYIDLELSVINARANSLGDKHPTMIVAASALDRFKKSHPAMPDSIWRPLAEQRLGRMKEELAGLLGNGLGEVHPTVVAQQATITALAELIGKPVAAEAIETAPPENQSHKILIEDLALHLIVAIREKDDAKLKSLASDRIKGWPEALPVFAVEMREHYRQMVGDEKFDLRAAESLVDGDLAAVKCTGPEKLKGVCLILFFVKTADGWRNHSLRNAPVGTPLAKHLADFKAEIEKKKPE